MDNENYIHTYTDVLNITVKLNKSTLIWAIYLYLHLFIFTSIHLYIFLFICTFLDIFIFTFIYFCEFIYLFISLYVNLVGGNEVNAEQDCLA